MPIDEQQKAEIKLKHDLENGRCAAAAFFKQRPGATADEFFELLDKAERAANDAIQSRKSDVQLYAKIREDSKYHGQQTFAGTAPFPVTLEFSALETYPVKGNNNQYRLADVDLYTRGNDKWILIPTHPANPRKRDEAER